MNTLSRPIVCSQKPQHYPVSTKEVLTDYSAWKFGSSSSSS
eukprot:SAG25_NODE_4201_length_866_cov_1.139505_1_plen_40_part_10